MYKIYDPDDNMHEIEFVPGNSQEALEFSSLDSFENFLDDIAEAWDCIDDAEEGTVYEVTLDGETVLYLIAIAENSE